MRAGLQAGTRILVAVSVACLMAIGIMAQQEHQSTTGYTPQRVYDSREKRFSDFEAMLMELSRHDVVFVGEQHDDPATHKLERAILEGLSRRRSNIVLSLEMFERDVQSQLNDYLAGRLAEEEFLKNSRPWPRYATDYRPLVEFAKAHNWPVVGGNVPRKYASRVSREGLPAIDTLPAEERKFVAAQIQCPLDDYFKRFSETMGSHPGANQSSAEKKPEDEQRQRQMIEKFYQAQCVKDETMAESIAASMQPVANGQGTPMVVHFNGAFHSDYRLGTAARVNRRLPKSKIKVVTVVPLDNLDQIDVGDYKKRGDFVIFTLKSKAEKK